MRTKTALNSRTRTFTPDYATMDAFFKIMFDSCAICIRYALIACNWFCRVPKHYSLTLKLNTELNATAAIKDIRLRLALAAFKQNKPCPGLNLEITVACWLSGT